MGIDDNGGGVGVIGGAIWLAETSGGTGFDGMRVKITGTSAAGCHVAIPGSHTNVSALMI